MKTNKDYILRSIAGEYILIPTGAAAAAFNGMINLSEVAGFVWQNLDGAADLEELVAKVVEEYEVDPAVARADVQRFVDSLVENNMAEL